MNLRYNVPTFVFGIYRINCQRFATLELNLKSAYTGFWFIQGSVYTGFRFIQGLAYRIPAYSGHGLNSILVYSGFGLFRTWFKQYSNLFRVWFWQYPGFLCRAQGNRLHCIHLQEFSIFYFKNTCTCICSNLPVVLF